MAAHFDLLLVAAITVYVVDISGFTDSWRRLVARSLNIRHLRDLPPFDCGKCMTWWTCLFYALLSRDFTLGTVAFSALLSLLSNPIAQAMIFIREWLNWIIQKLMPRWTH